MSEKEQKNTTKTTQAKGGCFTQLLGSIVVIVMVYLLCKTILLFSSDLESTAGRMVYNIERWFRGIITFFKNLWLMLG